MAAESHRAGRELAFVDEEWGYRRLAPPSGTAAAPLSANPVYRPQRLLSTPTTIRTTLDGVQDSNQFNRWLVIGLTSDDNQREWSDT